MLAARPGSVTAAAVLAIIVGSLGTFCSLCSGAVLAAQGAGGQNLFAGDPNQERLHKHIDDTLQRDVPGYQAYQVFSTIFGLIASLAILIAGIALLGMRSWARTLALVTGALAIVWTAFEVIYQAVFYIPAIDRAFQALPPPLLQGAGLARDELEVMRLFMTLTVYASVLFNAMVVVLLLIMVWLLCRRHVRAAFAAPQLAGFEAGPRPEDQHPGDYEEDQDWDRPGPRRDGDDDWRYR